MAQTACIYHQCSAGDNQPAHNCFLRHAAATISDGMRGRGRERAAFTSVKAPCAAHEVDVRGVVLPTVIYHISYVATEIRMQREARRKNRFF
jgi:hypothetical protein